MLLLFGYFLPFYYCFQMPPKSRKRAKPSGAGTRQSTRLSAQEATVVMPPTNQKKSKPSQASRKRSKRSPAQNSNPPVLDPPVVPDSPVHDPPVADPPVQDPPIIPDSLITSIVERVTEQVTTQMMRQTQLSKQPSTTLTEVPIVNVIDDVTNHVTGTTPNDLFQSGTLSIDAKVTNKLKEKIWSNEYIDFGSLLVNPVLANKFHLTFNNSQDGQIPALSLEPNVKPKKVKSIEMWGNAFRIFVGVYTQKFPNEAPLLMKYSEIIHDLAARGHNWHYYDENFRFVKQSNSAAHPWGQLHWELWLRSQTHRTPQTPKPGNSAQSRPYMQIPRGYCYNFHMGKECTGCSYKHECFKCNKGQHKASSCNFRPYHNNKTQPRAARSSTTTSSNTNKS